MTIRNIERLEELCWNLQRLFKNWSASWKEITPKERVEIYAIRDEINDILSHRSLDRKRKIPERKKGDI